MAAPDADPTPAATLSLIELRTQLLQRAAATAARARTCRARGDIPTARLLERRAAKLMAVARSMKIT